jgi:serine/threonine protein kinase
MATKTDARRAGSKRNVRWPFPRATLQEALTIPSAIRDLYAGHPCRPQDLGAALRARTSGNRFRYLTAASRDYGLTTGAYSAEEIRLTQLGRDLIYASNVDVERHLKMEAFLSVEVFSRAFRHFNGSNLPETRQLRNVLSKDFGLRAETYGTFSHVYRENCEYLGITSGAHQPEMNVAGSADGRLSSYAIISAKPNSVPDAALRSTSEADAAHFESTPGRERVPSLRKGLKIDAYQLDNRLGRGHSAEVWKAKVISQIPGVDLKRGSTVAIKIYLASLLRGFQPLRIQREFSVASEVIHENFARVYDLLLSPSRPFHAFMAMEFVDGPTLKSFIEQRERLTPREVLAVGTQLFSALAELHSLGAVHRDVKAANIMVAGNHGDLKIKLVDLGIVSVTDEDNFTQASQFLGSKHSAPLEQLTGEELDERTDIYGAGSVLFHCIRGIPMYHGVGPEGAIVRKMLSTPERLTCKNDTDVGAEREVWEFVNRCISVAPKDRPSTARECIEVLAALSHSAPSPEQSREESHDRGL